MSKPDWRRRLAAPGLKLGLFAMEFATPGLPAIAKAGGADFMVLDMELSGFGFETVKAVCAGGRAAGLPVVVRVAHRHPNEVSRALDMGADGLMAPLVSSAREAEDFVSWATYPPRGGARGVALGLRGAVRVLGVRRVGGQRRAGGRTVVRRRSRRRRRAAGDVAAGDSLCHQQRA